MKTICNNKASFFDMKLPLHDSKKVFFCGATSAKESLCSVPLNNLEKTPNVIYLREKKSETNILESSQSINLVKTKQSKGHSSYLKFKKSLKREQAQSKSTLMSQAPLQLNSDKFPVNQNIHETETLFANRSKSAQILRPRNSILKNCSVEKTNEMNQRKVSFCLIDKVVEVDNWKDLNKAVQATVRIPVKERDDMCILF